MKCSLKIYVTPFLFSQHTLQRFLTPIDPIWNFFWNASFLFLTGYSWIIKANIACFFAALVLSTGRLSAPTRTWTRSNFPNLSNAAFGLSQFRLKKKLFKLSQFSATLSFFSLVCCCLCLTEQTCHR